MVVVSQAEKSATKIRGTLRSSFVRLVANKNRRRAGFDAREAIYVPFG
jgi:hypothetical protein